MLTGGRCLHRTDRLVPLLGYADDFAMDTMFGAGVEGFPEMLWASHGAAGLSCGTQL